MGAVGRSRPLSLMDTKVFILLLFCIAGAVLVLYLYFKFFKMFKVKNIVFIDGALGTGKTFLTVSIAVRLYKRNLRAYFVKKFFLRFLRSFNSKFQNAYKELEMPLLYSNIRLRNIKFVKLTKDLLFRKKRFAYKSVVLIDEFSLVADQMLYKDKEINERLSLFFKLFRHETRGGYCIINSQSVNDLHFSLKYVLSDYLYIHHKIRFPFVTALACKEMKYCSDPNGSQMIMNNDNDVEDDLRYMLVFNKIFKSYDTYCYSCFTDKCEVVRKIEYNDKDVSLKDYVLVSFKDMPYLLEHLPKEDK